MAVVRFASLWLRAVAFLLDLALFWALLMLIDFSLFKLAHFSLSNYFRSYDASIQRGAAVTAIFVYDVCFWASKCMRITSIRLVKQNSTNPNFSAAVLRAFIKSTPAMLALIVNALPLFFSIVSIVVFDLLFIIMIVATVEKTAPQDLIACTRVVKLPSHR